MKTLKTVLLIKCMLLFTFTSLGASQFTQLCISDGKISFQSSEDHHEISCKKTVCCEDESHDDSCIDLKLQDDKPQRSLLSSSAPIIKTFIPNTYTFEVPTFLEESFKTEPARFYANSLSPPEIRLNTPITSFKTVRLLL